MRGPFQLSQAAERQDALGTPCAIPAAAGVYGWWFRTLPTKIDISGCLRSDMAVLLYVGISPTRPATNGRAPSTQTLRSRIRTHFAGNAESSTLRKTLGILLAQELGIELRRVGSGKRMTFGAGEQALSTWMSRNAVVSWLLSDRPWDVEQALFTQCDLPLNLQDNSHNPFHEKLTAMRAAAVARARAMPVLANPGVGGR